MGLLGIFKPKALQSARLATLREALDRARSIHQQGRHMDALAICNDILARQPDYLDALFLSADIAVMSGDSDRALQIYERALDLQPSHASVYYKYGNFLKDRRQTAAALANYDKAIELNPGYAQAFCNRGFVLERLAQWDAALESYDSALALNPDDALAHYNRAEVLRQLARREEAVSSYTKAISLRPHYFEAYSNLGFLLIEMKRWDEALASLWKSIEINPGFAPTHFGCGIVLHERKDWDAALTRYDQAIKIDPAHAEAHFHRGAVLMELRQLSAARSSLERAVALKPDLTDAYYSLGNLWMTVGQYEVALANFDKAVALKPDYAEAHLSRATLLVAMKKFLPAIESFDRGAALKKDSRFVLGARLFAKRNVCDWSDAAAEVNLLAAGIEAGEMVSPPHQALVLLDSVQLHHKAAQMWVQATNPPNVGLPLISGRPRREKARIGYFSGEFYLHPVPVLMAGVFETHDRSQYEVIAFSYGAHSDDDFGMRLQRGFDRFIDVRGKSDRDVAALARELQIDIAVDLAGHTGRSRTGIFASRAAPLQVNYLGYAGTMGAEYMDYVIADATVVPAEHEPFYTEKIVRLPNSFLPYDPSREISSKSYTRDELGLPATGFVFCSFNNSYKITPEVFDSWMRILLRVPNSVLWLSQNNETVVDNLRRESLRRGVTAERLIFAEHMASPADHLARHRAADLFLDTRPYNAHSTAIDALWAGLPVLTFPGAGFASRVAASLLKAAELPELIATDAESYEDIAVQMAEDPLFHGAIREKLIRNRLKSPLFDTPGFVRYLESGYARMLDRLYAGLPPEHIHVPR